MKVQKIKKVILLGTNHSIQRGNNLKESFQLHLEHLVGAHNINAIAEEINEDEKTFPVARDVSKNDCIIYKVIEPKPSERDELGIERVNNINYEFFMRDDDLEATPQSLKKEYDSRVQDTYRAREAVWLEKLQELDTWPVLVICGANHFQPFERLLSSKNFDVVKDNPYWGSYTQTKSRCRI
jgi:hypothetical protein